MENQLKTFLLSYRIGRYADPVWAIVKSETKMDAKTKLFMHLVHEKYVDSERIFYLDLPIEKFNGILELSI